MHKVLIVDDDFLLRNTIRNMLNWEKHGFMLCEEAVNGVEALNAIEKDMPQIILSDVRMPVMDGLQLSSIVKQRFPQIKIIMLSNYDDFDYVKGALKNGAVDYILKHTLNTDILLDSLSRAGDIIEKSGAGETEPNVIKSYNNLSALRSKFVLQLLTGLYRNENDIKVQLNILDINIQVNNTIAVIMVIDGYNSVLSNRNLKDASFLENSVTNITGEILADNGNGIVCCIANGRFVILLSFTEIKSRALIGNMLNSTLSRIGTCLKKFLSVTVSFSIGDFVNSLSEIPKSYESAEKLLDEKFYEGNGCILNKYTIHEKNNIMTGLGIEAEKKILLLLRHRKFMEVEAAIQNEFNLIKSEKRSQAGSMIIFNDLLGIINKVCKESGIEFAQVYKENSSPSEMLTRLETLDSAIEWISDSYKNLFKKLQQEVSEPKYSEYVIKAINYIKMNYAENISQSTAANHIGISSAYLSSLFKNEVGIGFSEYLCEVRINKSKALLEEGKLEAKKIAGICGFNNHTYFFEIFKKRTGVTPGEYESNFKKSIL